MTEKSNIPSACQAICAACVLLAMSSAWAGEDTSPLSLTLSHEIQRDSNIPKSENGTGDTINTTAVRVGLDKDYGRQNYNLAARYAKIKYSNFSQLDNDAKTLTGAVSSGFMQNWVLRGYGTYDENLNLIQNNTAATRLVKNLRRFRDGGASVRYGNGGTWAVEGSYDANKVTYTKSPYNDSTQETGGLKALYFSSDLLSFGLGGRNVKTKFVNRNGLEQTDKNLDLSTTWTVTGLSTLDALLTRRATSYNLASLGTSNGWGGTVNWTYTPAGLTTYNVLFSRTTGSDRQPNSGYSFGGPFDYVSNADTLTTALNLSASYKATGKITIDLSHNVTQYKQDNSFTTFTNLDYNTRSYAHSTGLSVNYAATRSLRFGCNYSRYSQTRQDGVTSGGDPVTVRIPYDGYSTGCNASFTFD